MALTRVAPQTLTDLLFEKVSVGLCLVAPDSTIVRANSEWLRSTGFSQEQVVGENILELFPATRDMALAMHARARAGHRIEVPRHAFTLNGRETWWEGSIDPVEMAGGTGLLITAREVFAEVGASATPEVRGLPTAGGGIAASFRRRDGGEDAAEALAAEKEKYRNLFQYSLDAVYLTRADGTILEANPAACRLHGMTAEEIAHAGRAGLVVSDDRHRAALQERATTGRARAELTMRRKDGSTVPVEAESVLLEPGRPDSPAFVIARDISARKHAEEALREAEARFRTVVENSRDGISMLDLTTGRYLFMSPAQLELTGFTADELRDLSVEEVLQRVHPDDRHISMQQQQALTAGRDPANTVEYRWKVKTGEYRWFSDSRRVVRDPQGRAVAVVGVSRDITDRKRAEDALRRSEERLRLAQQVARVGTFEFYPQTNTGVWSRELEEVYGLGAGGHERTYEQWAALVHPEDLPDAARRLRESLETGQFQAEWRIVRPDGEVRWLAGRGQVVRADDGNPVRLVGVNVDITERKRIEEALRRSEQKFAAIYDHAQVAIALVRHPQGTLIEVNDAYERMFGWSRAEAVGRTAVELGLVADPDRRARLYALAGERGSVRDFECAYLTRSGGPPRVGLFSSDLIDIDGEQFQLGTAVDITDRKRAEEALHQANEQLKDADRRKDEFLGMLSHELRNPLAPIRNSTYILQHVAAGCEQARRAQTVIQRQTEHLTRLVDDLLDVTRIGRGKIELRRSRVDLRELVSRTAEDFRWMMRDRGVRFVVVVPDQPLWADVDGTRVTQVVGNLLHNAAKFTRGGDTVTLSLEVSHGSAEIRVRDSGAGIEPDLLPQIFEAFVQGKRTLARTEGGLGLGLALVKGITELHAGSVHADSAGKGRGAEFKVRLPLLSALEPDARQQPSGTTRNGGRRVLVVDDDMDAAESLADLVRLLGHSVEVAFDGPSAIEQAKVSRPDVVLCDIGLPGMDGYEVARALRAAAIDGMQVVAVSGYAQPEDVKKAVEAGFDAHLAKPCDPETIARLLS